MTMPRTVEGILAHADELAARFEDYEPNAGDELDVMAIRQLRAAVAEQSAAERHLISAVKTAREAGMSWATIGTFVGTSGEAARQRYSSRVP
ncbi:MAG: hypothetical protein LCH66_11435 [Actinobacteria bacterium]|jgi:hypothetical protein|nr:hypothetical protein [Actinomycetota bacterium]